VVKWLLRWKTWQLKKTKSFESVCIVKKSSRQKDWAGGIKVCTARENVLSKAKGRLASAKGAAVIFM
jgi:hypothetical protein